jgi:multiple sugar transport system permease protein
MAITAPAPSRRVIRRRRGLFAEIAHHWADYLYVFPALFVMVLVIGYPIFYTIYLSFFETPANEAGIYFAGLENYRQVLTDNSIDFGGATRNTFIWTILSTGIAFVLGFGAALVVHRQFPGRSIARGILLIPYIISQVPTAYIWRWLFHSDYGLINGSLREWGLIDQPIRFLDDRASALYAVTLVNIWKEFPFAMILLLAGLQTVPEGLLRAARVDGAGVLQTFWHVIVPHLRSVILICTILLFVTNLNSFTLIFLMTGGGPAGATTIWIIAVYALGFLTPNYGLASAFAVILFLIMVVLGYFYVRALTGGSDRRLHA